MMSYSKDHAYFIKSARTGSYRMSSVGNVWLYMQKSTSYIIQGDCKECRDFCQQLNVSD